jgi:multidrug efflux system membrane fusion protein
MNRRLMIALMFAAVAALSVLTRLPHGGADEDEDKPITSSAAQVSHDAAGHVFIAIRPAAQKEIGLTTETLKPVMKPVEVEAYGFVLDPTPLSRLNSDLVSAQAALDASQAQYRRSRRLYGEQKNVSLRDLQTAQAAYLTDRVRLQVFNQQLRDTWGAEIAQMNSQARAELVEALVDRREAIARVSVPSGAHLAALPRQTEIIALGQEDHPLSARAVDYAPTVDPRMQGQSFLVLVGTKQFAVSPGTAVSAHLPASGAAEQGVMVPRSAVVRYAGKEWLYQELDGNRFVRREILPVESTSGGYFVTQNLKAGMRIVTAAAQTLLSEELRPEIQPED